jgi:Chaperone of endosialidase
MSFRDSMIFKLPFRFGAGILTASCLSATAHAQNVGIGVGTPQSKLSINGTTASGGLSIGDGTYTSTAGTIAPVNGAIIKGYVGIGTTAPVSPVNVVAEGSNGATSNHIRLESYGATQAPAFYTLCARGTKAAPVNLVNGDALGAITNVGYVNGALAFTSGINTTYLGDGTTNVSDMGIYTSGLTRMYIDPAGNMGIGTSTPLAPLHVVGTSPTSTANGTISYFNYNQNVLSQGPYTGVTSATAIFSGDVWTQNSFISLTGTLAASDARLKNIIGRSDSAKDLEILKKIEIFDYTMKDVVNLGNTPLKKVIAQQVEEVYPTAVKTIGCKGVTFTPDIYAAANSVKSVRQNAYTISLAKTHGLKEGETVRLITEKNPELNAVAHVVDEKTFTVTTKDVLGDKVFVYGKQCLDLKGVDYDAIAMLNVSATQELAKKVEALEAENAKLKSQVHELTDLRARMQTLEKAMVRSHESRDAVRTVSLTQE